MNETQVTRKTAAWAYASYFIEEIVAKLLVMEFRRVTVCFKCVELTLDLLKRGSDTYNLVIKKPTSDVIG